MCGEAERLAEMWMEAVDVYSDLVQQLAEGSMVSEHAQFKSLLADVARARLNVQSTRKALNSHRADHRCGGILLPPLRLQKCRLNPRQT